VEAGERLRLPADVLALVRAPAVSVMAEADRCRLALATMVNGIRSAQRGREQDRQRAVALAIPLVHRAAERILHAPMVRGIHSEVTALALWERRPARPVDRLVDRDSTIVDLASTTVSDAATATGAATATDAGDVVSVGDLDGASDSAGAAGGIHGGGDRVGDGADLTRGTTRIGMGLLILIRPTRA
jgi:hypothetical protein